MMFGRVAYVVRPPDRRLGPTPCAGREVLRHEDAMQALLDALPDRYRAFVLVLRHTELCWIEVAAVRRATAGADGEWIRVAAWGVDRPAGVRFKKLKRADRYTVPMPPRVREALTAHLVQYVGSGRDDLVFTDEEGTPLHKQRFRERVWYPAVEIAGLPSYVDVEDLWTYSGEPRAARPAEVSTL